MIANDTANPTNVNLRIVLPPEGHSTSLILVPSEAMALVLTVPSAYRIINFKSIISGNSYLLRRSIFRWRGTPPHLSALFKNPGPLLRFAELGLTPHRPATGRNLFIAPFILRARRHASMKLGCGTAQ
jgi:hypothetical protein